MPSRLLRGAALVAVAISLVLTTAPLTGAAGASVAIAPSTQQIASLALANVGKGAGTCSHVNASPNSLGGSQFGGSCTGASGSPEYWCADFAEWVWQNAGFNVAGLNAAAGSFVASGAGVVHTDPGYVPQVGDAIVYDYNGQGYADHVGIVSSVLPSGAIQTVNGDFGGSGSYSAFAETSSVKLVTISLGGRSVGATPKRVGMTITDYVTPTPPSTEAPAAYLDAAGVEHLAWRTTSGTIAIDQLAGSSWKGPTVIGTNAWTDPSSPGLNDVFYANAQGFLEHSYELGSTWSIDQPLPQGSVAVGGDPVAALDGAGVENVFWRGADGTLEHDYFLGGRWRGAEVLASGLVGNPSVVKLPSGTLAVAFVNVFGSLEPTWFSGSRWSTSSLPLVGGTVAAPGPDAVVSTNGALNVLWRSFSGRLYDDVAQPASVTTVLVASAPAPIPAPSAVAAASGLDAFVAAGHHVSVVSSSITGLSWRAVASVPLATSGLWGRGTSLISPAGEQVFWISRDGTRHEATWSGTALGTPIVLP